MKATNPTTGERYRSAEFQTQNTEERTIEVSCSSDLPIRVGGYYESLRHSPDAVDLSRFLNKASVRLDHAGEQIGVVERAWLDGNKLRASIRFSRSAKGTEVFQDVVDGIRANVSVRYNVSEYRNVENREGLPAIEVTKWQPMHLAILPDPADASVGFNRSYEGLNDEEREQLAALLAKASGGLTETTATDERASDEEPAAKEAEAETEVSEEKQDEQIVMSEEGADTAKEEEAKDDQSTERAVSTAHITVRDREMKTNENAGVAAAGVVLNDREQKQYSFIRAIRAQMSGERSGFEWEISQEIAKQVGRDPQGVYMLTNQRAWSIGDTATAGAMTFAEGGQLIDYMRNKTVAAKLGAQMLSLPGKVSLPRLTSDTPASWVAEDGAGATVASGSADQVTFHPKKLISYTHVSKETLNVANYAVEAIIRDNMFNSIAVAYDKAAIQGTGTNQPTGLLNTAGLISGSSIASGSALTFAGALETIGLLATNNADTDNVKFLTTPSIKYSAAGRIRSGSTAQFIVSDEEKIGLYPVAHSNNCLATYFIAGNWDSLMLAEFGAIDLITDPYTSKHKGLVELAGVLLADVQIGNIKNFAVQKNII